MDIIDRIFQLLEESKTTAKHFSDSIGVSSGNVSDWKSRRSRPGIDTLSKIADYFKVTIDYLVKGEQKPVAHDEQPADPELAELWKEFDDMSLDEAAKTLEYVRFLKLKRMT